MTREAPVHRLPLILLLLPLASPAAKQISIVNAAVAQFDGGPAAPSDFKFAPGETVSVSFQIAGYEVFEKDHVLVLYKISAFDSKGIPLIEAKENKVAAELAPEDKDWRPKVREDFVIPATAGSGSYKISAWVKDNTTGVEATKEIPFSVRAHEVEPSDTLVIRNFLFYRGENESQPLKAEPSFRPGDAVWARFDITGFKYGPKNHYGVNYGLSVHDATGKELYAVPEAAADTDESFYAKRFVPGMLSFTLPPDMKPGLYSVTLHAADTGGKQTVALEQKFRVE